MTHRLTYHNTRAGADREAGAPSAYFRAPGFSERIALTLMEQERARASHRTHAEPSRPRRFSCEEDA